MGLQPGQIFVIRRTRSRLSQVCINAHGRVCPWVAPFATFTVPVSKGEIPCSAMVTRRVVDQDGVGSLIRHYHNEIPVVYGICSFLQKYIGLARRGRVHVADAANDLVNAGQSDGFIHTYVAIQPTVHRCRANQATPIGGAAPEVDPELVMYGANGLCFRYEMLVLSGVRAQGFSHPRTQDFGSPNPLLSTTRSELSPL